MPQKPTIVISQARNAQPAQQKLEQAILAELRQWSHVTVAVIPHLYDLAPQGPAIQLLARAEGNMVVLSWLYPRASFWVLNANGIKGRLGRTTSLPEDDVPTFESGSPDKPERTIWCFDLRTYDNAESFLKEIAELVAPAAPVSSSATNGHVKLVEEAVGERWYPVIDYDRCENCLECLNFCLFGVFGLDALNRVVAEQPDACRPGCPACSRICPQGAIMFPQHHDPGIAGDPKASKGLKLDLSQLFRGANPAEIAAAERQRALAEQEQQKEASQQEPRDADKQTGASNDQNTLDHLVDEVDDMDL